MIKGGLTAKFIAAITVVVVLQACIFVVLLTLHNEQVALAEGSNRSLAITRLIPPMVCDMLLFRDLTLEELRWELQSPALPQMIERLKVEQQSLSRELNKGNAGQRTLSDDLCENYSKMFDTATSLVAFGRSDQWGTRTGVDPWQTLLDAEQKAVSSVSKLVAVLDEERSAASDLLNKQAEKRATSIGVMQFGIVIELLILVVVFAFFKADLSKRLQAVIENLRRLANRTPLDKPVSGNDEISTIDSLLHQIDQTFAAASRNERSLVENSQDLIFALEDNFHVASMNPACNALLGYRENQLVGRPIERVIHVDDMPRLRNTLSELAERGDGSLELRMRTKDSKTKDTQWFIQRPGKERSYFCVVHDISFEKQVDRLRHNVLRMVSHDLKSPLLAISSFLEMLQLDMLGKLTRALQADVEGAHNETASVQKLITSLLDIEKVDAGMMEMDVTEVPLNEILERAVESVSETADSKGIYIHIVENEVVMNIDAQLIERAISSLLSCTITGSRRDGAINLSSESISGTTEIRILATHLEVPAYEMPRLFDRFGEYATKRGWGLDLALCQAFIERHGGKTAVETSQTGGTVFCLKVPRN